MKCYYHSTVDAVALCKSCSRALCLDCCADVPPGIACKGKCEEDVSALNMMIQRGKTMHKRTGKAYQRNAIATLLIGLIFSAIGVAPIVTGNGYGSAFMAVLGAVFILWSYFSYQSGKQIQETEKRPNQAVGSRPTHP